MDSSSSSRQEQDNTSNMSSKNDIENRKSAVKKLYLSLGGAFTILIIFKLLLGLLKMLLNTAITLVIIAGVAVFLLSTFTNTDFVAENKKLMNIFKSISKTVIKNKRRSVSLMSMYLNSGFGENMQSAKTQD
ncbi:hypothetical protein BB561_003878 [Smittium simulii]|uniref:Uncharacterized protein n=1 Tax=Smittium simulii TaxID=133385 RepID=A0A2T9YJ47_9FUNG|nr:hypothetical protein BB561_003878 [Smittium simulii]